MTSLSASQCAEVATWAKGVEARTGRMAVIKVDHGQVPGEPVMTAEILFAHPDDYIALRRWADDQERWLVGVHGLPGGALDQ